MGDTACTVNAVLLINLGLSWFQYRFYSIGHIELVAEGMDESNTNILVSHMIISTRKSIEYNHVFQF